ncbi:hypothetical protein DRO64_00515 [Candidatus Bathyarchaeota archaeon]|nr:MAG: hypothetical protein DRO64_00515 [Candidatus Bathyarchaeota archaeon]
MRSVSSMIKIYVILIIYFLFAVIPLWSCLTTSITSTKEVGLISPWVLPPNPTLEPFSFVLKELARPIYNGLIQELITVTLACLTGSFLAYYTLIRWKKLIYLFIVGVFTPPIAASVPTVLTWVKLGLYNTNLALGLTRYAYVVPITVLLFRSFYAESLLRLIEAARIDGADDLRIYAQVILPLSKIPLVVASSFLFTITWNCYVWALVLGPGPEARNAIYRLSLFLSIHTPEWNYLMAGVIISSLPVVLLYVTLGKYILAGYTAGMGKAV